MHYEIRGLIEENMNYFIESSVHSVLSNRNLSDHSKEELSNICIECVYNRVMGFHRMWMMIAGNTPEQGYSDDVLRIVNNYSEQIVWAVDDQLSSMEQHEEYNHGN